MRTAAIIGMMLAALLAAPALGACPPPTPGETAAEIQANNERLVCLQNELAADAAQRRLQMQIDAINDRLRDMDLQRRFDSLPPPPVVVIQTPQPL